MLKSLLWNPIPLNSGKLLPFPAKRNGQAKRSAILALRILLGNVHIELRERQWDAGGQAKRGLQPISIGSMKAAPCAQRY
jgi:hypothetical protein